MPPATTSTTKTASCIIHCRVSSSRQAHEGESLEVQESICKQIAIARGWQIAREAWKESFSGRKRERPIFQDILDFLDARPGKIQYYLCRSIDRFTRGGSGSYEHMKRELARRGVEVVDSYGIIQPMRNTLEDLGFEYDWSRSSPSEIAEVVVATSAKHEVTTILTRLIGQEIRLRRRGYKVRQPADGFVNAKIHVDGRKHTIERPDPERSKYLITMFQLRAAGRHSDQEICERVNAMGYRTRTYKRWDASHQRIVGQQGGRPLTPKHLQEIIRRPIYCGVICEKWTDERPIRAAYPGLVSIETFNKANRDKVHIQELPDGSLEILYDRDRKRSIRAYNRNSELFPFKGVVVCPHCRKPLLGSSPRGGSGRRYPTYHCFRKHPYFGVKKSLLDAALHTLVQRLRFHPEALPALERVFLHNYRTRQAEVLKMSALVGSNVGELEIRKAQAIEAFKAATTDLMRRSLESDAEDLDQQIKRARTVGHRLELTEQDIEDFVRNARAIMERPAILLENPANARQQQALYELVFDRLPTYPELINGTAKLYWVFYLCSESETPKSGLVRLQGLKWNVIEEAILHWKQLSPNLPLPRSTSDNVPEVLKSLEDGEADAPQSTRQAA